jgi:hypothetical protein
MGEEGKSGSKETIRERTFGAIFPSKRILPGFGACGKKAGKKNIYSERRRTNCNREEVPIKYLIPQEEGLRMLKKRSEDGNR